MGTSRSMMKFLVGALTLTVLNGSKAKALPSGWTKHHDTKSGHDYYMHTFLKNGLTKQTTQWAHQLSKNRTGNPNNFFGSAGPKEAGTISHLGEGWGRIKSTRGVIFFGRSNCSTKFDAMRLGDEVTYERYTGLDDGDRAVRVVKVAAEVPAM